MKSNLIKPGVVVRLELNLQYNLHSKSTYQGNYATILNLVYNKIQNELSKIILLQIPQRNS